MEEKKTNSYSRLRIAECDTEPFNAVIENAKKISDKSSSDEFNDAIKNIVSACRRFQEQRSRAICFLELSKTLRKNKSVSDAEPVIQFLLKAYNKEALPNQALATDIADSSDSYCFDDSGVLTIRNQSVFMKIEGISGKYNEITHKNEFHGYDNKESSDHINDNIIALLFDSMQHDFKKCTTSKIKEFLDVITTRNKFNPVLEMLDSVEWDGTDRLEVVYDIFGIEKTDALSRTLMKKWFMQCICGLHNTISNPFSLDIVLIFKGTQGAGKTRFFEHLAMDKRFFGEGVTIDTRNKDSIINSTSKWISELGEIGTTMKRDIDALKAFLTSSTDTYRQPYGKTALEYPRLTSFCGTTNDEQFLVDETGNRRFATIPLRSDLYIDYDKQVKTFDSLQFWKQIEAEVNSQISENGNTYANVFRLTRDELASLNERNKEFEKSLKGEEEVTDVLTKLLNNKDLQNVAFEYITVTQFIQDNIELRSLSSRQVGKVLEKLGYSEIKKKISGTVTRVRKLPRRKYNSSVSYGN